MSVCRGCKSHLSLFSTFFSFFSASYSGIIGFVKLPGFKIPKVDIRGPGKSQGRRSRKDCIYKPWVFGIPNDETTWLNPAMIFLSFLKVKVNPPQNKANLLQSKQGAPFGFQVYIYIERERERMFQITVFLEVKETTI